jgi:hypothetical protein
VGFYPRWLLSGWLLSGWVSIRVGFYPVWLSSGLASIRVGFYPGGPRTGTSTVQRSFFICLLKGILFETLSGKLLTKLMFYLNDHLMEALAFFLSDFRYYIMICCYLKKVLVEVVAR